MKLDFRVKPRPLTVGPHAPGRQLQGRLEWLRAPLLITILLVLISGCGTSDEESDVLILNASDSLLVNVLIDLHAIDAALYTNQMNRMKRDEPIAFDFSDRGPRDSVFALNGLDSTSFNQLIEEHLEYPDRFLMVYNRVLDKSTSQ